MHKVEQSFNTGLALIGLSGTGPMITYYPFPSSSISAYIYNLYKYLNI